MAIQLRAVPGVAPPRLVVAVLGGVLAVDVALVDLGRWSTWGGVAWAP